MSGGYYKVVTARTLYSGLHVVSVQCSDDGDPPLTSQLDFNVTVTQVPLPIFPQNIYKTEVVGHGQHGDFVVKVFLVRN